MWTVENKEKEKAVLFQMKGKTIADIKVSDRNTLFVQNITIMFTDGTEIWLTAGTTKGCSNCEGTGYNYIDVEQMG